MSEYTSKAVTTKIVATSRVSLKVKENFYTIEYSEERSIPDVEGVDMDKERTCLFDDANAVVDKQAEDILKSFKK